MSALCMTLNRIQNLFNAAAASGTEPRVRIFNYMPHENARNRPIPHVAIAYELQTDVLIVC